MSVTLTDLVDHIRTDFATDSTPATVGGGKDLVIRHGDPEVGRVVLVPTTFQLTNLRERTGGNPRPVARWVQTIEAHVWARATGITDDGTGEPQILADLDLAAALGRRTAAAIYRYPHMRGMVEGSGDFTRGNRTAEYGVEVVIAFSVDIDVLDASWATVSGVQPSHTGTLVLPSGNADGCGG